VPNAIPPIVHMFDPQVNTESVGPVTGEVGALVRERDD